MVEGRLLETNVMSDLSEISHRTCSGEYDMVAEHQGSDPHTYLRLPTKRWDVNRRDRGPVIERRPFEIDVVYDLSDLLHPTCNGKDEVVAKDQGFDPQTYLRLPTQGQDLNH